MTHGVYPGARVKSIIIFEFLNDYIIFKTKNKNSYCGYVHNFCTIGLHVLYVIHSEVGLHGVKISIT